MPRRFAGAVIAALLTLLALLGAALTARPVAAQVPPANDSIADATVVGAPDLLLVDTSGATTEPGEPVPTCAPPGPAPIRRTVWYAVEAHADTLRVATAGSGTSFRPILALYQRDAAGRMIQVACGGTWGVTAEVAAGQTYYLQVGGAGLFASADAGQVSLILGPVTGGISRGGPPGPVSSADLLVSLADSPDPVAPGGDLTATAAVNNGGPSAASSASLTLVTPAATTFRSVVAPAPWTCTTPAVGAAGPVQCSTGSLAPNAPVQVTLVVQVDPGVPTGTTLLTSATVSAASPSDPVPGNNAASAETTVRTEVVPAACAPRPNVRVEVEQTGPGQLLVTVRSSTNPGTSVNALQEVRITTVTNAVVDVPNGPQGVSGDLVVPLQAGAEASRFTLRRVAPGPFKADLIVTDVCGAWPTFVGGGAGVP